MVREDFQRARSDRERAARRVEILDAAEALIRASGSDKFTISSLAEKLGISASTIFLYFSNREDLLASLYVRATEAFFDSFRNTLRPGMSDQEYCEGLIECCLANPTMMILRPAIQRTIENSLSQAFILPAVQRILAARKTLGAETEEMLGLEPGRGMDVLRALVNLIAGATQASMHPYFGEDDDLPEQEAEFIHSTEVRASFLSSAALVMKGARC